MAVDLTSMSRKELLELQANVEKALKDAEQRERIEALKAAEEAAAKFGFSLDDLMSDTGKGPKGVPRFANPADPAQTWTGRGRKPKWVNEWLDQGNDLEGLAL